MKKQSQTRKTNLDKKIPLDSSKKENSPTEIIKKTGIKVPTNLKRPLPSLNDNPKVPKVSSRLNLRQPLSSANHDASLREGTTFTIPPKPDLTSQKPIVRTARNTTVNRSTVSNAVNTTAPAKSKNFVNQASSQKKRPFWDLRGRIVELETAYNEKITELTKKISDLENESEILKTELAGSSTKISEINLENTELKIQNNDFFASLTIARNEIDQLKLKISETLLSNSNLKSESELLEIEKNKIEEDLRVTGLKLSQLEHEHQILLKKFEDLQDTCNNLADKESILTKLSSEYVEKNNENKALKDSFEEICSKHKIDSLELEKLREQHLVLEKELNSRSKLLQAKCDEVTDLHVKLINMKNERETLQSSLQTDASKISTMSSEKKKLTLEVEQARKTIDELKLALKQVSESRDCLASDLGAHGTELKYLRAEIVNYKSNLAKADCERRQMHHQIMELRGTIRVCCRIRPVLSNESNFSRYNVCFRGDTTVTVSSAEGRETVTGDRADSNKHEFCFDRVFGPDSSQKSVFSEIEPLVQSALDGFSVCIFAYGQTGSGKTYTMEGDLNFPEKAGLIKRAVDHIFSSLPLMRSKGWEYVIQASFLEIYNENLIDLLTKDVSGAINSKLEIKLLEPRSKKDTRKNGAGQVADVCVPNLTTVTVETSNEVNELLETACKNRTVAATRCNEFSSRSHNVFRLKLCGRNELLKESSEATINLVDLAGSERLDQSRAEGDRMRETQCINKSLSCLKTVITALQKKELHIPFRDSKLTHLLQSSLGGNCKTLMIVNISPLQDHFSESLCSLRFAANVNKCFIGNATQKKTSLKESTLG